MPERGFRGSELQLQRQEKRACTVLQSSDEPDSPNPGVAGLGLALYAGSTVFNSGQSTLAKLIGQQGFPVFQTVLTRSVFICLCAAAPVLIGKVPPLGKKPGFLLLRGACSFVSVSALFWSVTLLPLADALVLQFLSPLMIAVMAPLLIQEKPSRSVLVALPVCIVAVVLIAQPSALFGRTTDNARHVNSLGVAVGVFQAFAAALNKIVTRYLKDENANVNLLYLGAVGSFGSIIACTALQDSAVVPQSAGLCGLLLANAVCAYLTQMFITLGLQRVGATLGTALSYLTVVWGILFGYFLFDEVMAHPHTAQQAVLAALASAAFDMHVGPLDSHKPCTGAFYPVLCGSWPDLCKRPLAFSD